MTLDEAVQETISIMTGLDLSYETTSERYRIVVRALNRALRANALEKEWGFYSGTELVGSACAGDNTITLRPSIRPRVVNDDAVRLLDDKGTPRVWAYFLPRDALHKYRSQRGLWCAVTGRTLEFSRPFTEHEHDLEIEMPVMREPKMFDLPPMPRGLDGDVPEIPAEILNQEVDFQYPDLIIAKAAFMMAQFDPVAQPRVQALEAQYKDLMYQVIERDDRATDSPYINDFVVPVHSDVLGGPHWHGHRPSPHSSLRGW